MKIFLAGENMKSLFLPSLLNLEGICPIEALSKKRFMEKPSECWKCLGRCEEIQNRMNIYLAGIAPWRETGLYDNAIKTYKPFTLESYYYADDVTKRLIPHYGDFLLDSGAFTFMMNGSIAKINWNDYIEKYAAFINENHVDKFFELDIDSVVGYEKVIEYRRLLEKLTNKQCIPVWHTTRGRNEYIRSVEEYSYVAYGGIAGKGAKNYKEQERFFPWFIKEAHRHKCKIHGLGYTSMNGLKKYHFDSVDSTAWTTGNRFGMMYHWDGSSMQKIDVPKGKRFYSNRTREVALHNYLEWIKFQKWAITNL